MVQVLLVVCMQMNVVVTITQMQLVIMEVVNMMRYVLTFHIQLVVMEVVNVLLVEINPLVIVV